MFHLRLLGGASLEGPDGPVEGRLARRHPLALLALLVRSPGRTVSRDRAIGLLWPDFDEDRARNRLRQAVHALRSGLGTDALISVSDQLRLNAALVESDVGAFEAALERGEPAAAVELYAGHFLDGFYLNGEGAFDRWVEEERAELAGAYREALEALAEQAGARGDAAEAAAWWKRLAAEARHDGRVTLRLMQALAAAGDRAGALEQARIHRLLLEEEFEAPPSSEVLELERRLREAPAETVVGAAREPEASSPDAVARAAPDPKAAATASPPTRAARRSPLPLPALAAGGGVTVAIIVLLSALPTPSEPAASEPGPSEPLPELDATRIVVSAFQNETRDPELDYVETMAADWIARGLLEMGSIEVVPLYGGFSGDGGEAESVREAAIVSEAGLFITGTVRSGGTGVLLLEARIGDSSDGSAVRLLEPLEIPRSDVGQGVDLLRQRVMGALATHMDPRLTRWAGAASQPPSLEAYRLFNEGLEHILGQHHSQWHPSIGAFIRAAEKDSLFTMPLLWALYVGSLAPLRSSMPDSVVPTLEARWERMSPWERAFFRAQVARMEGDWEAQYRAYGEVVRLSPRSEWRYPLGRAALLTDRVHEAVDLFRSVDLSTTWVGEVPFMWDAQLFALHRLGEYEEQLSTARRGLTRFPTDRGLQRYAVSALIGLGAIREARAFVDSIVAVQEELRSIYSLGAVAWEFAAHGYAVEAREYFRRSATLEEKLEPWKGETDPTLARSRRRQYGKSLLGAGRWDEAYAVFSELAPEWSDPIMGDADLGEAALRTGRTEEFDEILARLRQQDRSWTLARLLALKGDTAEALQRLRRAPGAHWAAHDPAFAALRSNPAFQELIRPKG